MRYAVTLDSHVHLHAGVGPEVCLDAAHRNMAPAWGNRRTGILFLADVPGGTPLDALPRRLGRWTLAETAEAVSRIARRDDGGTLILVGGRQIVTAEGLEVLGAGLTVPVPDGLAVAETVALVTAGQGLAILPWGFGKWTGTRLGLLRDLLGGRAGGHSAFLADSGVRPAALPRPRIFAEAEAMGWRVLAGTDPLPLPGEALKPGRFGNLVAYQDNLAWPFAALADELRGLSASPPTYGRLETLPRAVRQQVAMQLRKRMG